jgi:hypothetical protein
MCSESLPDAIADAWARLLLDMNQDGDGPNTEAAEEGQP